jgi:hypothetical protein
MTTPLEDAYQLARAEPAPLDVGDATLRYLGLNPDSIESRALVLVCRRYRLDPLLGHVEMIDKGRGRKPYITRDGYLEIAHRSGVFDGMTTDEERRNSTGDGWTAYVIAWRKDMSHGFRYGAQCKDSEALAKQGNGPEMALARAERRALKRAFNIPSFGDDDDDDVPLEAGVAEVQAPVPLMESAGPAPAPKPRYRSAAQLEKIRALMLEQGIDDDTEAAAVMSQIVARQVGPGHPQLDYGEADRIIDDLTTTLEAPL